MKIGINHQSEVCYVEKMTLKGVTTATSPHCDTLIPCALEIFLLTYLLILPNSADFGANNVKWVHTVCDENVAQ